MLEGRGGRFLVLSSEGSWLFRLETFGTENIGFSLKEAGVAEDVSVIGGDNIIVHAN